MARNLFPKPALFVIGFATLGVLSLATFFVVAVSVQRAYAPAHPRTPDAIQQFDEFAQNESVAPRPDSPKADSASMPQSEDGFDQQTAPAAPSRTVESFDAQTSAAGQTPQYAPAAYTSASSSATGWTQQASPDGSATVALPANWRLVEGAKGAVSIQGPSNESVVLGMQTFVTANQAPYMAPEQALAWFMRTHGSQLLGIQNREQVQQQGSGQAELIVAQSEFQGRKYKVVAKVTTSQIGLGNWMLQVSWMGAPVEQFDAELPAMQKIWNSWKLDNGYVQGGFETAARIHQQTTQMAIDHARSTVHRWDSFNEGWDQTIRGVSTMENTDTGKRAETQIGTERQVQDACRRQGINCRQVPTNELVQPQ